MPSLTRLPTGGVLNPLKNTTNTSHNELLHQDPLQPPLEPRGHEAWAESVKPAMPRANASGAKPPGHAGSEDARGAQEGNGSACAQARQYGDG